nr:MAG TPA: minor tail protein [Caudoviricetes sp.]
MDFNTKVQRSGAGRVRTMTNLHYPDWTITSKVNYLTDQDARALFGFVASVKGAYEPFLWKDPEDYHEMNIQLPMIAPGKYQCVMKFGAYVEPAAHAENVKVYVSGVEQAASAYTVANGVITITPAPAASAVVTATYDYWWKVRFKDDGLGIKKVFADINRSKSFKLEVTR